MAKPKRLGAEEARAQLASLLIEAERGRSTVITKHGRSVAVLVPFNKTGSRQKALLSLAGSGKGLWTSDSRKALRALRDEWTR